MNIANKLTILRVLLVPIFVFVLMTNVLAEPFSQYVALTIFIVAALTDFLDGHIARSRNLVTTFGKFMDPLADKLLVVSALICFVELDKISAWIVIIIVSRDFIISGVRLVAASAGKVIAASWWGKIKTVVQMLMIIILLMDLNFSFAIYIEQGFIILAVVLTVISLLDYILKNIEVFKEN